MAGISPSSAAKMDRGDPISMEVILKICAAPECGIGDICEAVPAKPAEQRSERWRLIFSGFNSNSVIRL